VTNVCLHSLQDSEADLVVMGREIIKLQDNMTQLQLLPLQVLNRECKCKRFKTHTAGPGTMAGNPILCFMSINAAKNTSKVSRERQSAMMALCSGDKAAKRGMLDSDAS